MIPPEAIAPLAAKLVEILAEQYAATQEPPEEVVTAWRRITAVINEANARVQAIRPVVA